MGTRVYTTLKLFEEVMTSVETTVRSLTHKYMTVLLSEVMTSQNSCDIGHYLINSWSEVYKYGRIVTNKANMHTHTQRQGEDWGEKWLHTHLLS